MSKKTNSRTQLYREKSCRLVAFRTCYVDGNISVVVVSRSKREMASESDGGSSSDSDVSLSIEEITELVKKEFKKRRARRKRQKQEREKQEREKQERKKGSALFVGKPEKKKARSQSKSILAGKSSKKPSSKLVSKNQSKTKKVSIAASHNSSESEVDSINKTSEKAISVKSDFNFDLFSNSEDEVVKKFYEIRKRFTNGRDDPFSKPARIVRKCQEFVEAVTRLSEERYPENYKPDPIPAHMYLDDEEIGLLPHEEAVNYRFCLAICSSFPENLRTPDCDENPVVPFGKRAKVQAKFCRFLDAAIFCKDKDSKSVPWELFLDEKEFGLLLPVEENLYIRCLSFVHSPYGYSQKRLIQDPIDARSQRGMAVLKFYDFVEATWQLQDDDPKPIPLHMYLDDDEILLLAPEEYCFYECAQEFISQLPIQFQKFVCEDDLDDSLGKRAKVQAKFYLFVHAAITWRENDIVSIPEQLKLDEDEMKLLLRVEENLYHSCLDPEWQFCFSEDDEKFFLPVFDLDPHSCMEQKDPNFFLFFCDGDDENSES